MVIQRQQVKLKGPTSKLSNNNQKQIEQVKTLWTAESGDTLQKKEKEKRKRLNKDQRRNKKKEKKKEEDRMKENIE